MAEVANVDVPQIRIPVRTGRNMAIIIGVAVMSSRIKTIGYDAIKMLEERLTRLTGKNPGEQKEKM